ncbi:kinase-like domain-containing protein [Fomes fomentarius]|nr:kinase-like domain-containing protein [Fomes fomentarius]
MHSPQNSETFYEPHRPPYSSTQSYGTTTTSYTHRDDATRFPPTASYPDQHSDSSSAIGDYPVRGPRTPPRSPVGTSISTATPVTGTNGFRPGSVPNDPPGAAFTRRGAIDEDGSNTIRPDDRTWVEGFIDENAAEGNARSRPKAQVAPTQQLPTPPPTTEMPASVLSTIVNTVNGSQQHDDSSSESDEEGGTIWAKPPSKTPESQQPAPSHKQKNTRPPLAPLVFPSSQPPLPDYIPQPIPPRTPRRTGAITSATKKHKDRISKFDNNFDMTWAPRPPPEVMYEKLEEYFPEHDLDKPVIEAPSGGTSPITTEAPAAAPVNPRFKHKKSIRVVAAEHKRQMDRTSRGDDSSKRHTKLWGSKLEEVTTDLGRGTSSSTSDSSPGGGVKPIFRWVRGELIGKGTYGRVYLALNATTGEMIAVKQVEMPRTASDKDDTRQVSVVEALKLESETLKDLDHPHIVQYLGFEETPTFLSIFLEYVPGGSIASCLRKHGRFDEEVTKSFTGQILDGLEYLHSRGILHRDLKADNILVETSGVCKMADFGISKRTDDINMAAAYTSMQGTVFWMAPEVINSKGKGYNSKIDIWSVGCVVFEMWTGQRPWSGQEAMAVLIHLYSTKQPPPVPEGIQLSALADDFRLKCFAADPDERPTAAELRKHPYLELQPGWVFNGFK